MKEDITTFLPGLDSQYKFLIGRTELEGKKILIIGSESENIAVKMCGISSAVNLIVEDYESLINSKLKIDDKSEINVAQMDFEFTDFESNLFDLVYAQASINNFRKNKIIKEIKRILKPGGLACIGEIITFTETLPKFIIDLFNNSDVNPILETNLERYYSDRQFQILDSLDLSFTLKDYYSGVLTKLRKSKNELTDMEKRYHKKLLNKISHEAKVYLNQGGHKYFGFKVSLLKLK